MRRRIEPLASRAPGTRTNVGESWGMALGDMSREHRVACMIRQIACMKEPHRIGFFRGFAEHHSAEQTAWLKRHVSTYLSGFPNRLAPIPAELQRVLDLARRQVHPPVHPQPVRPPPAPPVLNGRAMANRFTVGRESIRQLQRLLEAS